MVTGVTAADICGVSGILPAGANWESSLVLCGANSIAQVPADRWQLHEHADATNAITNRMRHVGFISCAELVDNAAFEISPTECVSMDPCQRLMLESAYTASHDLIESLISRSDSLLSSPLDLRFRRGTMAPV